MAEKTTLKRLQDWAVEEIPNKDELYYNIHKQYYEKNPGIIPNSGFKPQGHSMSTNWGKYSTPAEALNRAKEPEKNKVVKMNVGDVRDVPLKVIHSPNKEKENRAHTDVLGLMSCSSFYS